MKEHALVPLLTEFAKPIANSLELTIWGIRIIRGKTMVIQCFVDKDSGATIDDCTNFSRALSAELDMIDEEDTTYTSLYNLQSYTLEVSTPGVERCFFTLSQLEEYIGQKVSVALEQPIPMLPNRRKFTGILSAIEGSVLCIDADGIHCECPWDNIERIQLIYFDKS
ncbi:MAG: ribosome maturation factor RimP [Desulfovibrionaceae bacterium]|nr:ribosome maturation factor RimP [Desulfovibrionaceae bacterium]